MLNRLFKDPFSIERLRCSPLGPHLDSFATLLEEHGYSDPTARSKLRLISELGQWFGRKGLGITVLDEHLVAAFLDERRRRGRLPRSHSETTRQFLAHLRNHDAVPSPEPVCDESPQGRLLSLYEKYLRAERGLTTATVSNYMPFLRRFLTERFGEGPLSLQDLAPSDISGFILGHAGTMSPGMAKLMVTALRSFFRFLLQRGEIHADLAASVPAVAGWRLAPVPRYLSAEEIGRLLEAVDRRTPTGRRNYAILLLLARLGLRAGEIVTLDLEDIDWRAGEIAVRGKGLCHDRLPLVPDVGEALAAYLQGDRPKSPTRRVFLRMRPPYRGLASRSTVSSIVYHALGRAGLDPPNKGAHLLRHSLATGMLHRGASMAEIGELLRHRTPCTTEIYAKVDLQGLRSVAQPWPDWGGGQ